MRVKNKTSKSLLTNSQSAKTIQVFTFLVSGSLGNLGKYCVNE